jgi:hypothetical protein
MEISTDRLKFTDIPSLDLFLIPAIPVDRYLLQGSCLSPAALTYLRNFGTIASMEFIDLG